MIKYKEKIININTLIDELTEVIQDAVFMATEENNYISLNNFKLSLESMYKALDKKAEVIECRMGETRADDITLITEDIVKKEKEIKYLKNRLSEMDQAI